MKFNANFLSTEMKKRKLTDQDLAFEMLKKGVRASATNVYNWRHGRNTPHLLNAASLSSIFNCSIDAFVDWDKN
jgi:transcriptional regulator with XRE-family HTH domain